MSSDWPVASALMAGRYRLVSLLETGGMSEIWRAEDELLDRPVAVKLPTSPQVVWREARMAARLSHPGIAAVHDYREAVRPDGTVVPFVVMELLTGESVAARVDRELIGWAEAARIGAAVADALAAAHASGVVHRDIKPGNVMLTPNGVKILDFGISVAAGEPDDDDTGATFGTPAYVAPERLDGMPAEPATDVYGVGVLLFEMVTGDPPYPVETWEELAAARTEGPSELPDSLPADFREVVERCLDADPVARPTAARLRADLLAVALRSRPASSSSPGGARSLSSNGAGLPVAEGVAAAAANDAGAASAGDVAAASERRVQTGDPVDRPGGRTVVAGDDEPAGRPAASGAIGHLVRAAGVSTDQPPAEGHGTSHPAMDASRGAAGPAAGSPSLDTGAPGARHIDAGGTADPVGSIDSPRAGVGEAVSVGANRSGRPAGLGGPRRKTPNAPVESGSFAGRRPRSRSARGGGAPRSSFAFTAGDEARDWRPDEHDAGAARRPAGARNFATGRASAATLDMVEPPRRRTAVGVTAAVVLTALVGVFAVLAWTHRDPDRNVAVPPPATAPALPSATATTPTTAPSTAASTSAGPSPKASLSFADAVSRMRAAVESGAASKQIRPDVAQDLLNLLGPLSNAQGSDLTGQVQALRQKIQTRVGEGGVSQSRAAVLQSRLEDLDRAAGT